jgi:hypothetical protein
MTDSTNIDKALAYLGTSLKTLVDSSQQTIDLKSLPGQLPKRSLSGDHINGGKIINFSSSGIKDEAKDTQITITDTCVTVKSLLVERVTGDLAVDSTISAENISVRGTVKANKLEVNEITSDLRFERSASLEFKVPKGEKLTGKGLIWVGDGHTKQFIFSNPDKFFSSESIDLSKDKHYAINGASVLSATELGVSITTSNLRKVGTLQGLLVNGNVTIDQYIFYNSVSNRLGLGTDQPNAGLSIAEDGIEVIIGTANQTRGVIGTYASTPFDVVTDNTARISVSSSGDIDLGNLKNLPIQVRVHGTLAVKVNNPDPNVDLHVNGPIRFHGHLHFYSDEMPTSGTYRAGDIAWNNSPSDGKAVGWICVKSGTPGIWSEFGLISQRAR